MTPEWREVTCKWCPCSRRASDIAQRQATKDAAQAALTAGPYEPASSVNATSTASNRATSAALRRQRQPGGVSDYWTVDSNAWMHEQQTQGRQMGPKR